MTIEALILKFIMLVTQVRSIMSGIYRHPRRKPRKYYKSRSFRKMSSEHQDIDGFDLITYRPDHSSDTHVFLLPGGAYILDPVSLHWTIIKKLVRQHHLTVTMFRYPKAPEHTFQRTHQVLLKAYLSVINSIEAKKLVLMGDSAGGGLALSLLQIIRDQNIQPYPRIAVLISPWVNLELNHPDITTYAKKDYLLSLDGLYYAAEKYSGGADLQNPLLSPIHGDLSGLGQFLLVYGTEELFYPDCQLLEEKLTVAPGSCVQTIVGEGLGHDWLILPLKQSRDYLIEVVDFIKKES
jgi:acetyl esterase/lipase